MTRSLASYRYLIVDVDGVLRRSRQALPGAPEFLPWLLRNHIDYRIATNNGSVTPTQYVAAFAAMGIATDERHIISSATGTAWYLKRLAPKGAKVHIVGGEGVHQALLGDGFFTLDDEQAAFVVVGLDRTFTYDKLSRACTLIRKGARFIATNTDATYPMEVGLVPGGGAIVAAVQVGSGAQPTVIGKPQPTLFDMALDQMGARREQTAVLGDRLDTDIAGAVAARMDSIMVLTGVNNRQDIASSPVKPTVVFDDLPALMAAWERAIHGQ
jgi:4-nitrophenyl phosphatase